MGAYSSVLVGHFKRYQQLRYAGRSEFFEPDRPASVVFRPEHRNDNVLVPTFATDAERKRILATLPLHKRHRHFGSMRSSQALAQSVFGTIGVFGRLSLLARIRAECGRLAFDTDLGQATVELEKEIAVLGEPTPTSVDVWLEGHCRIAIECKFSEVEFGTCSQVKSRNKEGMKLPPVCDGRYRRQAERVNRCALTERDVQYWKHAHELFGWHPDVDHDPCPLKSSYQLARNVMAACVESDSHADPARGYALVIYDHRNPAMGDRGRANLQWRSALSAVVHPAHLRRLSWQSLISQWPRDEVLNWLGSELDAKYGLGAGEA